MSDTNAIAIPTFLPKNAVIIIRGVKYRTSAEAALRTLENGRDVLEVLVRKSFAKKPTHTLVFRALEYSEAVGIFRPVGDFKLEPES